MEATSPTRLPWWPLPALLGLAYIVFWPTLNFSAFSDDHSALWNCGVRGIPWRNGFFRPLSDLSFRIGYWVFGADAFWHRCFNVALHGLNAFLLFVLLVRISSKDGSPDKSMGALAASLLFLIYPFHQESIVWLVGRESSLGTYFTLLGLLIVGSRVSRPFRQVGLAVCLVIGALCYESALLLIPLALLFVSRARAYSDLSVPQVIIALVCGTSVYIGLRLALVGWSNDAYVAGFLDQDFRSLLYRAPKAIARLFLPPEKDTHAQLLKGAFLLTCLLITTVALYRASAKSKVRSDAVFIWIGMLLICCSIPILAGVSTVTSESDRFLYMPSAFLCALFGNTVQQIRSVPIRRVVWLVVAVFSFHFMRHAHRNWQQASLMTRSIMEQLPVAPEHGRLFVLGLPDNYDGAFIFRNGFPEAVRLSGQNGDRVVDLPPISFQAAMISAQGLRFRGSVLYPDTSDRWYSWNGTAFRSYLVPLDGPSTP